jgi:6-pyruvoyl-tetrahydropterin synthase
VLKKITLRICDSLDHHFLLPQRSKDFDITKADGEWEIRFKNRRYVLPAEDVLPLPVDNITAERLAEYIFGQLVEALHEHDVANLTSVTIGVEEAAGQTAFYQRPLSQKVT